MTLDEAKLVKAGDYIAAANEVHFRKHATYRVTCTWANAEGTILRFYVHSLGSWVSFEGFAMHAPKSVRARAGTLT